MAERLVPSLKDIGEFLPTESLRLPRSASEILSNEQLMGEALDEFTTYMNKGPLDALIQTHPRNPHRSFPNFSLELHSLVGGSGYTKIPGCHGKIWVDGDYTLGLTYQHKQANIPTTVAIAGFMSYESLLKSRPYLMDYVTSTLTDTLIVVQLQGINRVPKNRQPVSKGVIQAIQWEDILMTSIETLCDQLGTPTVALLAARRNSWFPNYIGTAKQSLVERKTGFIMHYDVTAKNRDYDINKQFAHKKTLFE